MPRVKLAIIKINTFTHDSEKIGRKRQPDFQRFACVSLLPATGKWAKNNDVMGAVGCLTFRVGSQLALTRHHEAGEVKKKAFSTTLNFLQPVQPQRSREIIDGGNNRWETETRRDQ